MISSSQSSLNGGLRFIYVQATTMALRDSGFVKSSDKKENSESVIAGAGKMTDDHVWKISHVEFLTLDLHQKISATHLWSSFLVSSYGSYMSSWLRISKIHFTYESQAIQRWSHRIAERVRRIMRPFTYRQRSGRWDFSFGNATSNPEIPIGFLISWVRKWYIRLRSGHPHFLPQGELVLFLYGWTLSDTHSIIIAIKLMSCSLFQENCVARDHTPNKVCNMTKVGYFMTRFVPAICVLRPSMT